MGDFILGSVGVVGDVTGVKGEKEDLYRTGNVNLTSANIGALDVDNVYNGLDKTAAGYVLDARQGKALANKLDAAQSDIAIIIEGNQTTHTGGVAVGEYVIVCNSTISGITDGMYKATQAIPANTAIDSTYLTAVDGGGLNAVRQSTAIEEINAGTGMAAYKFQGFVLLLSTGNGPAIPSTGLPMPASLMPNTNTFASAAVTD